ncbi:hypothetical protein NFI96_022274 [Prochilodus magdalenae]|nr:hypothetical protein NFI96_022274 [Prochilodus magdalenae]
MRVALMVRMAGTGLLCRLSRPGATLRWISSTSRASEKAAAPPHGAPAPLWCFRLPCRSLLHIHGADTASFLQGIITNDMKLLEEDLQALYAHMLNVQGRTLYDIIIYSLKEPSEDLSGVLLECDSSVLDSMTRHLKVYKIRRKVTVAQRSDLSLWALLPRNAAQDRSRPQLTTVEGKGKPLVLVEDPRTELMGWRMITRNTENPAELLSACEHGDTEQYHRHRYTIGRSHSRSSWFSTPPCIQTIYTQCPSYPVLLYDQWTIVEILELGVVPYDGTGLPEGVGDLPPGEALPLESNLVFMNGISFGKGCYIGQELTARTHHTGVVRKRLMPLSLSVPAESLQAGDALESAGGKPAGKLRKGLGQLGLGLVRLAHAKEPLTLRSSTQTSVTAHAAEPEWWNKDSINK